MLRKGEIIMLFGIFILACGNKNTEPAPPPVGWYQEEGWSHSCYHPPEYNALLAGDRSEARENALTALLEQWNGGRGDGVSFTPEVVEEIEIALLGLPDRIEKVSQDNLIKCKQVATNTGLTMSGWSEWISSLPSSLLADQYYSLGDTVMDYLNIEVPFERSFDVCPGDTFSFTSTPDRYQITKGGEWITAAGDTNQSTDGSDDLPCKEEGCYAGMLLVKYTHENGVEEIYPVGIDRTITFPIKGKFSYGINDVSFYDNKWYQSGGIIEHTAVTIIPQ